MIDIFNFKKYFRNTGDNGPAKIGHVNATLPLIITDTPSNLGLVPEFIGQMAIFNSAIYVAHNATSWALIWD